MVECFRLLAFASDNAQNRPVSITCPQTVCASGRKGMRDRMGWEASMFALFDDLEQQAEGMHLADRDADVADLSLAEYAGVNLAARLHAALGLDLQVRLVGGHAVGGRLARLGEDWLLLVDRTAEWVVRHAGIAGVSGLANRADHQETWSVMDRLTLRTVLRGLSGGHEHCLVRFVDGSQVEGRMGRVGSDFFELHVGDGREASVQVVPVGSVTAFQGRPG